MAVIDSDDQVVPGRGYDDCLPFTGDSVSHGVRWMDGERFVPYDRGPSDYFKLSFLMNDGEIFAFEFGK